MDGQWQQDQTPPQVPQVRAKMEPPRDPPPPPPPRAFDISDLQDHNLPDLRPQLPGSLPPLPGEKVAAKSPRDEDLSELLSFAAKEQKKEKEKEEEEWEEKEKERGKGSQSPTDSLDSPNHLADPIVPQSILEPRDAKEDNLFSPHQVSDASPFIEGIKSSESPVGANYGFEFCGTSGWSKQDYEEEESNFRSDKKLIEQAIAEEEEIVPKDVARLEESSHPLLPSGNTIDISPVPNYNDFMDQYITTPVETDTPEKQYQLDKEDPFSTPEKKPLVNRPTDEEEHQMLNPHEESDFLRFSVGPQDAPPAPPSALFPADEMHLKDEKKNEKDDFAEEEENPSLKDEVAELLEGVSAPSAAAPSPSPPPSPSPGPAPGGGAPGGGAIGGNASSFPQREEREDSHPLIQVPANEQPEEEAETEYQATVSSNSSDLKIDNPRETAPDSDTVPPPPVAASPSSSLLDFRPPQSKDSPSSSSLIEEPKRLTLEPQTSTSRMSDSKCEATSSCSSCPFSPGSWFNAETLHPLVAELVYWKDPKKSGAAFAAGLVLLLSFAFCSIISVVAYVSLAALTGTLSFKIYKNILQAVQKTNEGHPFKQYLEMEVTPPKERVHQVVDVVLNHVDATVVRMRSIFLVEDIVDSLKYLVLFWCLTYIGSWFNGMTLVILAYLGLYSLPKFYEMNKAQVDQYLQVACSKIQDVVSQVKAKLPFLDRKEKSQ